MPVSNSGEVTLESGAHFLQTVVGPDRNRDCRLSARSPAPMVCGLLSPSQWLRLRLRDQPNNLAAGGTQVQINAPQVARAHLYHIYTVTCNAFQGGTVVTGNFAWEPLSTTIVHEPNCGDYGSRTVRVVVCGDVARPGYTMASRAGRIN